MLWSTGSNLFQHRIEFFVVYEAHDCGFGIAPRQIAKNLVDGFLECLDAFPEFAFTDEDVRTFVTN